MGVRRLPPLGADLRAWGEAQALHAAAWRGDVAEIDSLVARGYDVNAFDDLGFTPLHHAVRGEHFAAVRRLLEQGADVNAVDEEKIGNTPLRECADECSLEMARLLVDAGADPTIPGWMQLTALDKSKERERGDGPAVYAMLADASRRPRR